MLAPARLAGFSSFTHMVGDTLHSSRGTSASEPKTPPPSFISQQVTEAQRFYLSVERGADTQPAVVCGGWEECAAEYEINRATFPYHSIEFVASGEGDLLLGRTRHSLRPGMVFSYGPGVAQRIRTSRERRLRKYFVDFTGPRAKSLLAACGLAPGSVAQISNSADVQLGLDTLIRFANARQADRGRMCTLQLEIVLLTIKQGTEPETPHERRAFATFERCRQIVDAEFLTLRNVEEAAKRCHVGQSYLSRLFQTFCGVTPLRYIRQLQMQWAARRLHTSDALVREVADELGLDAFHFSRMFKRIHGLSPSKFVSARG